MQTEDKSGVGLGRRLGTYHVCEEDIMFSLQMGVIYPASTTFNYPAAFTFRAELAQKPSSLT